MFVLGAYPSALHVAWTPPAPRKRVQAIAVDNEPLPFWTGRDQATRIEEWKRAVRFDDARFGTVSAPPSLNGTSGIWVEQQVLAPLGIRPDEAWITDCLDTYRCSKDLAARIDDTYNPFAKTVDLRPAALATHPTEQQIITEAVAKHRERLLAELATSAPDLVITLGNAALAVIRELVSLVAGPDYRRLSPVVDVYGTKSKVLQGGREVEFLPLAHPAAPAEYQAAHATWLKGWLPGAKCVGCDHRLTVSTTSRRHGS